jgi:hypothetical protein
MHVLCTHWNFVPGNNYDCASHYQTHYCCRREIAPHTILTPTSVLQLPDLSDLYILAYKHLVLLGSVSSAPRDGVIFIRCHSSDRCWSHTLWRHIITGFARLAGNLHSIENTLKTFGCTPRYNRPGPGRLHGKRFSQISCHDSKAYSHLYPSLK